MVLALTQGGLPPPLPISPLNFYDSTPAPDLTTAGTLKFNEARFLKVMGALNAGESLLQDGMLLRFYSPISVRSASLSGSEALFTAPRFCKPHRNREKGPESRSRSLTGNPTSGTRRSISRSTNRVRATPPSISSSV